MSHTASAQPVTSFSVVSGPRRGGEVEVVVQPAEQRVADRTADQGDLLARGGEAAAELVDDRREPQQLLRPRAPAPRASTARRGPGGGGGGLVGHGAPLYARSLPAPSGRPAGSLALPGDPSRVAPAAGLPGRRRRRPGRCWSPCAPASAADDGAPARRCGSASRRCAPATIPQPGPGHAHRPVTNQSQQTWTDLNAYLLTSPRADPHPGELAAGGVHRRRHPGRLPGGRRRASTSGSGTWRPGASRALPALRAPPGPRHLRGARRLLGRRPRPRRRRRRAGLGRRRPGPHLHAAAAARQRRRRARAPAGARRPARSRCAAARAGRLLGLPSVAATLAPDGRLDRLLRLGRGNRRPVTWAGRPRGARRRAVGGRRATRRSTSSPSPGSGAPTRAAAGRAAARRRPRARQPDRTAGAASDDRRRSPRARRAGRAALARASSAGRRRPDRRGAALRRPRRRLRAGASPLARCRRSTVAPAAQSRTALASYGVEKPTDRWPRATGFLPDAALRRVRSPAHRAARRERLPAGRRPRRPPPRRRRRWCSPTPRPAAVAPAPTRSTPRWPVRQRLLSEAALHALSPDRDTPLVVSTPAYWNPGDAWRTSKFFSGLDQRLAAAGRPVLGGGHLVRDLMRRHPGLPRGRPVAAGAGRATCRPPTRSSGPARCCAAAAHRQRHRRRHARQGRDARLLDGRAQRPRRRPQPVRHHRRVRPRPDARRCGSRARAS